MDDYFQHRRSYMNLYSGIGSGYDIYDREEEKNWFHKNSHCLRQQLILFCSTPFFENYKSVNPDLCTHIYNISSFVNYGIGDINDLRNPLNKPFANILKVGINDIKYTLSNFLDNDDFNFHTLFDVNRMQTFKYNDDVFCFLLDTMFQKEDPTNSLKKAHNQLFSAYTRNLSVVTKILCKLRNENVLYTKTENIDLDTATQYSEELVEFTKIYKDNPSFDLSSDHPIYKDLSEKLLPFTQFLTNNIVNTNFKKIIKNSFNYKNTKKNILQSDPSFFYSMMLFLLVPTKFSPLNLFSIKKMFETEFTRNKDGFYFLSFTEPQQLLSDYYLSINPNKHTNLNPNSKLLHSLEHEIQQYFDIDPVQKEKNIESYCDRWDKSLKFLVDNPNTLLREAKIKSQLIQKNDEVKIRKKI